MAVDENTRRLVHDWAARSGGPDVANALMAMLPPVPAGQLALRSDLERMGDGLRAEMAGLRAELRGEMAELRGEMSQVRGEMTELRAEVRGDVTQLRGEIVQLRGEMAGTLHRLYAANVFAMIGVAGLVLAAASIT